MKERMLTSQIVAEPSTPEEHLEDRAAELEGQAASLRWARRASEGEAYRGKQWVAAGSVLLILALGCWLGLILQLVLLQAGER